MIRNTTLIFTAVVSVSLAMGAGSSDTESTGARKFAAIARVAPRADGEAPSGWEIQKNITVAAGKTYFLETTIDLTSAKEVAVTLRSAADSAGDLRSLSLEAYWSVPEAEHYNVAEITAGADFPYTNTGGTIFQVYGSEFRLVIRNISASAVVLQEIVVFARK